MERPLNYAAFLHVYNEETYLDNVLNAIFNQDVKPDYWLVVDDGSTDKTAEIVDQYEIDYMYLEQTELTPYLRRSYAFNAGIKKIKEHPVSCVLKIDGDTMIESIYAGELLNYFHNPDTAAVSGVSNEYNKLRNLNNGAVMYRLSMLPKAKPVYGWDKEIELDLISNGFNAYVNPNVFYTDLRPPTVIRPPLSKVFSNRARRKKAEIIGAARRTLR